MMFPMAGCFVRCRLYWPKGFCATRAAFTGLRRVSTPWSRSFWRWHSLPWCVAVRWSKAGTCPPGSGANCWAWIGCRKSKPCGEKSLNCALRTARQPNGRVAWPGDGWPEAKTNSVGLFSPEADVRVYHGTLPDLPRRYVARERLCLRGTTDYWINGLDGAPFFVLTQPVNPGVITVRRQSVVPRLLPQAPQPEVQALEADSLLPRFTLIFDREGYSPDFFAELKAQRIAILTYHKFPGQDWPLAEFVHHSVQLPGGQTVELTLAERGTRLSNGLWVRQIRELSATGTQSSILSH